MTLTLGHEMLGPFKKPFPKQNNGDVTLLALYLAPLALPATQPPMHSHAAGLPSPAASPAVHPRVWVAVCLPAECLESP